MRTDCELFDPGYPAEGMVSAGRHRMRVWPFCSNACPRQRSDHASRCRPVQWGCVGMCSWETVGEPCSEFPTLLLAAFALPFCSWPREPGSARIVRESLRSEFSAGEFRGGRGCGGCSLPLQAWDRVTC